MSVVGALAVSSVVTSGLLVTGVFAWDRTLAFLAPFVVGVHAGPAVLRAVESTTWRRVAVVSAGTAVLLALLVAVPVARRVPGAALLAQGADVTIRTHDLGHTTPSWVANEVPIYFKRWFLAWQAERARG